MLTIWFPFGDACVGHVFLLERCAVIQGSLSCDSVKVFGVGFLEKIGEDLGMCDHFHLPSGNLIWLLKFAIYSEFVSIENGDFPTLC